MVGCSVLGCKSRSERKISGISYHSFPSNPVIKLKWLAATGRENWQPTKYTRMCSLHFGDDAFILHKKFLKIRTDVAPSRLIHSKTLANTEDIFPVSQLTTSRASRVVSREVQDIQPENLCLGPLQNLTKSVGLDVQQPIMSLSKNEKRLKKLLQREKMKSASRLKKICAIRQLKRRLSKRAADLKSIITELKCKMQMKSDKLDLLYIIQPENTDFLDFNDVVRVDTIPQENKK